MHWKKIAVAAPLSALALSTLAGCGGSDGPADSSSSSPSAASSSSASSVPASAVASAGAEGGHSAGASSTPSSSASGSADNSSAQAPAPKGYQTVKAPGNGISLAVPRDFTAMKEKDASAEIQYGATALDAQGARPNVLVSKDTVPTTTLPTQKELAPAVGKVSGKVTGFEKISTGTGQGVRMDYSGSFQGITMQGALLVVPNGKGSLSMIAVTATDAAQVKEISENIASTVQKL